MKQWVTSVRGFLFHTECRRQWSLGGGVCSQSAPGLGPTRLGALVRQSVVTRNIGCICFCPHTVIRHSIRFMRKRLVMDLYLDLHLDFIRISPGPSLAPPVPCVAVSVWAWVSGQGQVTATLWGIWSLTPWHSFQDQTGAAAMHIDQQ